jgi:hypothetical protein
MDVLGCRESDILHDIIEDTVAYRRKCKGDVGTFGEDR